MSQVNTLYIVIEHDKIKGKAKPAKLESSLTSYRKKYAPLATAEEFTALWEQGSTKPFGLEIRVATDEDVAAMGVDPEIQEQANRYTTADDRAKIEKHEAAQVIMPFLYKKVKTDEELENVLTAYNLSTSQVQAMANAARAEGVEPTKEFIEAHSKLVSERSKSTKSSRTVAAVRKTWEKDA